MLSVSVKDREFLCESVELEHVLLGQEFLTQDEQGLLGPSLVGEGLPHQGPWPCPRGLGPLGQGPLS